MIGSGVRQVVYGALAVVGLVLTWYFNLTYSGPVNYVQAWFANSASSSAAVDLIIVSVAVSIFIVVEGRRLRIRFAPAFIVLGVVGAMACAVPLFLLFRERALATTRQAASEPATVIE